eukprot:575634-Prorocentrum_minimum.AAC.2
MAESECGAPHLPAGARHATVRPQRGAPRRVVQCGHFRALRPPRPGGSAGDSRQVVPRQVHPHVRPEP